MSEDKNMMEIIKHISEREQNLSKYSDKLRKSVIRIFNIFGDPKYCQVCGRDGQTKWRSKGRGKTDHDDIHDHKFTPKIRLSLDFGANRSLVSVEDELWIRREDTYGANDYYKPTAASRQKLKELVVEHQISEFLSEYLSRLTQAETEYAQVSEIASKLAAIVGDKDTV